MALFFTIKYIPYLGFSLYSVGLEDPTYPLKLLSPSAEFIKFENSR